MFVLDQEPLEEGVLFFLFIIVNSYFSRNIFLLLPEPFVF